MLDEKKLAEVANEGLNNLGSLMKADNPSKEHLATARLAASVLSTAARYEATQNSMVSLRFRVAQTVLKNNRERRSYLANSSPELKLLKT